MYIVYIYPFYSQWMTLFKWNSCIAYVQGGSVYMGGGGAYILDVNLVSYLGGGLYTGVYLQNFMVYWYYFIYVYIYIYYIYIYTYICILYIYTHFILNECAFSSETRVSHTWNVKSPPELIDSADVLMLLDNLNLMKVFKKN